MKQAQRARRITAGDEVARLREAGRTVRVVGRTVRVRVVGRDRRTAEDRPRERAVGRTTAVGCTRWIRGAILPPERERLLVPRRGTVRVGLGPIVPLRITGA